MHYLLLDVSIIDWLHKYCPGFKNVPFKRKFFGNEYDSITDGYNEDNQVTWRVELVEGRDQHQQLGK